MIGRSTSALLTEARDRIALALAAVDVALRRPLDAAGRDALLDVRLVLTGGSEARRG